ncbi:MAG: hypothetical protein WCK02_01305 [Bacteroidota bacterium]
MSMILKNRKNLAINLILIAILYLSVAFNKDFIRPVYGNTPIIGIITGSFSNFMAAYIISLFPVTSIICKKINTKKARIIVYTFSILGFLILTAEEIHPMWGASTQYDLFDILASALGSLLAILTFEIIFNWSKRKHTNI